MSEGHQLDEEYTNGIWRDMHCGGFYQIREMNDGDTVGLVNPENGDVYHEIPIRDWVESERHDFVRVEQEAVDNPVNYIERAIRIIQRNDIDELAGLPMDFAIGVSWAIEQVSIEEK